MRKNKSEKHYPSLRMRMFLSFVLFGVIVLAVLWLFQIVLLDDIYRGLKLNELETCADQLSESLMEASSYDDFDDAAGELAKKYGVDMPIVRAACAVLYENVSTARVVEQLLNRSKKPESEDSGWH